MHIDTTFSKKLLLVFSFFSIQIINADTCRPGCNPPPCCIISSPVCPCSYWPYWGKTFLLPRSQGLDAPRDMVGTYRFMHKYDSPQSFYGAWNITPQFMHSYKDDRIAEYFFGTDCLHIAGSKIEDRSANSIMADYFGLSPSFESNVCMNPTIANFVGDIGWSGQWKRLWASIHIPLTWTRWNFELCEAICNNDTYIPFPERYMYSTELNAPINSFTRALQPGVIYGDVKQGLLHGVVGCPQTKFGVADIRANIGYDIWLREHGHAGFYIHAAAPTGTRSKAQYLFEPVIGNGHHWEFGLGFEGKVMIWECDGDQELSLFFDGKLTHLFKSRQCRSFDFKCNCPLSRYMLVKTFEDAEYTRELIPAINITTLPCEVSVDAQLDIVAMVGYTYRGFEFDVGYNAWIRTREKLNLCGDIESNKYGFKGIQDVVYETGNPSNVTQSCATLHGNELTTENQTLFADAESPHYINTCDLDIYSAAAHRAFTNKLFMYLGYTWNIEDETRVKPFLGLGTSVEFEGLYPDYVQPNKNTVSQYSIWLKAGTGF